MPSFCDRRHGCLFDHLTCVSAGRGDRNAIDIHLVISRTMVARVLAWLGKTGGLRLSRFASAGLWLRILLILCDLNLCDLLVEMIFRWTRTSLLIGCEDVGQWLVSLSATYFLLGRTDLPLAHPKHSASAQFEESCLEACQAF